MIPALFNTLLSRSLRPLRHPRAKIYQRVQLLHQLIVQSPQVDIEVQGGTCAAEWVARGPDVAKEENQAKSTAVVKEEDEAQHLSMVKMVDKAESRLMTYEDGRAQHVIVVIVANQVGEPGVRSWRRQGRGAARNCGDRRKGGGRGQVRGCGAEEDAAHCGEGSE